MDLLEFLEQWSIWYPNGPPFRPSLRQHYPERWFRIHSLPDGKRFAKTEAEAAEMLQRHNVSGSRVLGESSTVAVVLAYGNGYRGSQESESVRTLQAIVSDDIPAMWREDLLVADYLGEDIAFAIATTTWRTGRFDRLIQTVGDGCAAPLLFFNMENGNVYSPYDGGADLFVCESSVRADIQRASEKWLAG